MLSRSLFAPAAALLLPLLSSPVSAQTTSDCNPLNSTCPADPAFGTDHTFYFNATPPSGTWNISAGTPVYSEENGAAFTIEESGDSTTIYSNFYFLFGRTEVVMKAANGTGICSTIVWLSDDLDEVDWEFVGGNISMVETNYFGKGYNNYTNAYWYDIPGGDGQNDWHNYTNTWDNETINWYIDGNLVRTLTAAEASYGGNDYYPQTPMQLRLGIWAAGDPSEPIGTIEWAQGETDYTTGPFTMYVKSARVEDASTGKSFTYSDNSGSWESITIADGNSTALDALNAKPAASEESVAEKFNDLSSPAKDGIYAACGIVGAALVGAAGFYYYMQRKQGQQEAAAEANQREQERLELEQLKEGKTPDTMSYEGAAGVTKGANLTVAPYADESRSNLSLNSMNAVSPTTGGWDPTTGGSSGPASPPLRNPASSMPLLNDDVNTGRLSSMPNPGGYAADDDGYRAGGSNGYRQI